MRLDEARRILAEAVEVSADMLRKLAQQQYDNPQIGIEIQRIVNRLGWDTAWIGAPVAELIDSLSRHFWDEADAERIRKVAAGASKPRTRAKKPKDWLPQILETERKLQALLPVSLVWGRPFDEPAAKALDRLVSIFTKGQRTEWYQVARKQLRKVKLVDAERPDARWDAHKGMMLLGNSFATRPMGTVRQTVIHELGHAFIELTNEQPRVLSFWGAPPHVSDYATLNGEEDFAETFMHYTAGKQTRALLKRKAPEKHDAMQKLIKGKL